MKSELDIPMLISKNIYMLWIMDSVQLCVNQVCGATDGAIHVYELTPSHCKSKAVG